MNRAIWSAPPPDPAGTTNSTGLLGCQAPAVPIVMKSISKEQTATSVILKDTFFIFYLLPRIMKLF
jgi:hypothetical protein